MILASKKQGQKLPKHKTQSHQKNNLNLVVKNINLQFPLYPKSQQ